MRKTRFKKQNSEIFKNPCEDLAGGGAQMARKKRDRTEEKLQYCTGSAKISVQSTKFCEKAHLVKMLEERTAEKC